MKPPTVDQLLNLADRGERKRLTGPEARTLRNGIRALAERATRDQNTIHALQTAYRGEHAKAVNAEQELANTAPYRATCPRCHAPAGQRCTAADGTPTATPHVARHTAAHTERTKP